MPVPVTRCPTLTIWCRRVRVLHLDESVAPTRRQGRRLEVDTVDAEAVEFLERREFPGDAFNEVRETR